MSQEHTELPSAEPGRIAELRLADLLFELLRAEKYTTDDDSLEVLSVFVPTLLQAGFDLRNIDIYVERTASAQLIDVRSNLAPSASLTQAINENLASAAYIEQAIGKQTYLSLACVSCDEARKQALLVQHVRVTIIDTQQLERRLQRLGLTAPRNWADSAQLPEVTDRLRQMSLTAMSDSQVISAGDRLQ